MRTDFYTNTHSFRQMEFTEIKELEVGDKIYIGIADIPNKMEFYEAEVIQPLFWNSDADEPDWEVETTNGFVDIYSIYEVKELFGCCSEEKEFYKDLLMEQQEQM